MLDGDVESFGPCVDGGILQADVANGRGVDQGHQLLGVVDEQAVEEVDVLALDARQVEVLVDAGLAGADHLERTLALLGGVLHDVGNEASEVLGNALGGSEGQALKESKTHQ